MLALLALFLVLVGGRGQLVLELVDRAPGLAHEAAQVAGHLRELAGAEDHQEEEPDDHYLLAADTEHGTNITRGRPPYNERGAPTFAAYILKGVTTSARHLP